VGGTSARGLAHVVCPPNAPTTQRQHGPPGPVPFRSVDGDAATDAAFLDLLRRTASATTADDSGGSAGSTGAALMQLRLDAEDVAKMTKGGTTCVSWHPCSAQHPLIAASDKTGQVALWSVDYQSEREGSSTAEEGGEGQGGTFEGIVRFEAHRQYVSAMRWVGSGLGAKLMSASYDGSVRLLDVEKGEARALEGCDVLRCAMLGPAGCFNCPAHSNPHSPTHVPPHSPTHTHNLNR